MSHNNPVRTFARTRGLPTTPPGECAFCGIASGRAPAAASVTRMRNSSPSTTLWTGRR